MDGKMKIWDLRMYRMLQSYGIRVGAGSLAFSQQGMVAAGKGNVVQVRTNCELYVRQFLHNKIVRGSSMFTDLWQIQS